MAKNIIREAIANIAHTSKEIEEFCNDPNSSCSLYEADLLERLTWKLNRQADSLLELDSLNIKIQG